MPVKMVTRCRSEMVMMWMVPMSKSPARMVEVPFHVFLTVDGTVMTIAVTAISLRGKRGHQGRRHYYHSRAQYFSVHRLLLRLHGMV